MKAMHVEIYEDNGDISEICSMYWALDEDGDFVYKVKEIAENFGTSTNGVVKTAKTNSASFSENLFCSVCEEPYQYQSRGGYLSSTEDKEWTCAECRGNHKKILNDKKIRTIENSLEFFRQNYPELDDLSFRHAVFLLSLIRFCGSEDLSYIEQYDSNKTGLLSPDKEFDLIILKELYRNNIIAINPFSDLDLIELNEEGGFSYYPTQVMWVPPLFDTISHPANFVKSLETKMGSMEYIDSSYDDVMDLCQEISLLECLSYLEFVLNEHDFKSNPG